MKAQGIACRRLAGSLALWLQLIAACLAQTSDDKVLDRYSQIGPAIFACWRPPAASAGMEITVVFSFKRDGEILGKPRISFSKLLGDHDLQKTFVASALKAISDCTPLKFTSALGGAIAGRPFALLFRAIPPSQNI